MRYLLAARATSACRSTPTSREVLGVPASPTLEEAVAATGRSTSSTCSGAPEHAPRMRARRSRPAPGCLWLQLGVVNWEAARIAHEAGLAVVMDRCTAIEHRRIAGCAGGRPIGFSG